MPIIIFLAIFGIEMKVFEINTVAHHNNAPGRIMLNISDTVIHNGGDVCVYSRKGIHTYIHGLMSRLLDTEGLHSFHATRSLINKIEKFRPDIIHLHNLHGHYINYPLLFSYFKSTNIPIVWTLHDCWPLTGHCAYYSYAKCQKWITGCHNCKLSKQYPKSWLFDNSLKNWKSKYASFSSVKNLTIVSVSKWMDAQVNKSFLKDYPRIIIPNGIDTTIFRPYCTRKASDNFNIIGVASNWSRNKGLNHLMQLKRMLAPDEHITIVSGISNMTELAKIYSSADLFLNPSEEESFGMTTIEAMACGTPVIVNNRTAMPEFVTSTTGYIADFSDLQRILQRIRHIKSKGKDFYRNACVSHVEQNYSLQLMTDRYIQLFHEILKKRESQ